jgi:hypothetical protein
MKNHLSLFVFLIIWLSLGEAISYFTLPTTGLFVISFFVLIAIVPITRVIWESSVSSKIKLPRPTKSNQGLNDNLSRIAFNVRNAAEGSAYSRREVAQVLREALLSENLGRGNFPTNWVATADGNPAVENILTTRNTPELAEILEPPDWASSFGSSEIRKGSKIRRAEYLSKLEKALNLIEQGKGA